MVVQVDVGDVQVHDNEIQFQNKGKPVSIKIENVIGCHAPDAQQGFFSKIFKNQPKLILQYMLPGKGHKWTAEAVHIHGDNSKCESLMSDVNGKLKRATEGERPKKLAVFINPIGGSKNAKSVYSNTVEPLLKAAGISCDVMISERPKHMIELISAYRLEDTDGIVILGGDGTVLEILNCLIPRVQEESGIDYNQSSSELKKMTVPIGVIPTGTGNGLSEGLYGTQDYVTAALHIIKGKTEYNNIQGVYSGGKLISYSAVVVAHGLFSDMMHYMDQQRWMRKMRYVVMPLHTVLIREKRLFNAKCTLISNKSSKEDDVEDAAASSQEETQDMAVRPTTLRISHLPYPALQKVLKYQCMAIAQRAPYLCITKELKKMFNRDFLTNYSVIGYKVKLDDQKNNDPESVEAKLQRSIDVDGEMFEFQNGEYEVRGHGPIVKYFTSL